MISSRRILVSIVFILLLILTACIREATPTPTATSKVVVTAPPLATHTPLLTDTPETVKLTPHVELVAPGHIPTASATPLPSATPTPDLPTLVVTHTPEPDNIITVAAQAMTATYQATTTGTPTPLMARLVIATVPIVIAPTETPENEVTAVYMSQHATAEAFLNGTPTAFPAHAISATPEPKSTPMPLLLPVDQLTPSPTPTPSYTPVPTPTALPSAVYGKILFLTDRFKQKKKDLPQIMLMDPDGSNVALVTDSWVYYRALDLDRMSPDGSQEVFVRGGDLWVQHTADGWTWKLHASGSSDYDPAWGPDAAYVVFVSSGVNDEIHVINKDTGDVERLTFNDWEWDKHPSFSPDGSKIVFWSNRDGGRRQIWMMNADGSEPVNLSNNEYNDWDPVWVKW